MNNRPPGIDYANLKSITDKMKISLKEKYATLDKIASEANKSLSTSSGGSKGSDLGDMSDNLERLFNQNVYNGTLKINGGIIVDYIESEEGKSDEYVDLKTVKKTIRKAIEINKKTLLSQPTLEN